MTKSLILGTVQFGLDYGITHHAGRPTQAHVFDTLDSAWDSGVRVLDTADSYGSALDMIASYHQSRSYRFQIITKTLRIPPETPAEISLIFDTLKSQRDRLDIEKFDTVMFHYAPSINNHVPHDFFDIIKDENITHRGGLSIDLVQDFDTLEDRFSFDVIQIPYNVLNGQQFPVMFQESLKRLGMEIHVRSAFLQGILLTNVGHIPAYLSGLLPYLVKFHQACRQAEISPLEGALLFLIQSTFPDHVVIGAQNIQQWQEIDAAWRRVAILKDGIQIDWSAFLCDNPDLVSPSQWAKLKEVTR